MRTIMRGTSPILVTAALSIAALIAAAGMQLGNTFTRAAPITQADLAPVEFPNYQPIEDADGNGKPDWQDELSSMGISLAAPVTASTTLSTDPLTSITSEVAQVLYGGYLSLKQYGEYSPSRGEDLANTVATNLRAPRIFVPHTVQELSLDADTSEARTLKYRADMRTATAIMVTQDEPELELFAKYVSTKDTAWLTKLQAATARYSTVEANVLALRIPKDAAPEHLRVANALGAYASTLERMTAFGNDALASAALLRTYNESEQEMLSAFDALAKYYVRKTSN